MNNIFPHKLTLAREGGETLDFTVVQIPLRKYPEALSAVNADDEITLCAVACSTTPGAIQQLTPEAFEILLAEVLAQNESGFFAYARRRKITSGEQAMWRAMAELALKQPVKPSASATPSPTSPPRPG